MSSGPSASFRLGTASRQAEFRCPTRLSRRAREYPLHPVLFDGALQIFSAGAATVEDHKPRLRLPVRFAKILFLRSPGDSSLVRAGRAAVQ